MAIISAKQFLGGKPAQVVQSASAPQITIPPTPKKSIGETVATEVLGFGQTPEKSTSALGSLAQNTIGSRGLGGAAKTIGRSIMAPTILAEANKVNEKRSKYNSAADKIIGMAAQEKDPARKARMVQEASSYLQQSSRLAGISEADLNLLPDPDLSHFLGQLGNTAATAASLATGGAAVEGANLAKPLTTLVKEGAKETAKIGAGYGAASAASEALIEDKGPLETAVQTGIGGIAGGIIGATGGALAPVLTKTATKIIEPVAQKFSNWAELATKLPEAVKNIPESENIIGRTTRQVTTAIEKRAELKATEPVVQDAVKAGIDQPFAVKINSMSDADKAVARKMLAAAEKDAKVAGANTKIEIPGNTIVSQAKTVSQALKDNGKYLTNEVVAKFPDTPITPTKTLEQFNTDLRTKGIKIVPDPETGIPKLDFTDSTLGGVTGAKERKIIEQAYQALQTPKTPAQYNTLRQVLFKDLELGKQNKVISKEGEAIAQRIRENLRIDIGDQVKLRSNGKPLGEQYLEYTQRVAEAEDTLSKFYTLLGKKFQRLDQYGGDVSLRAGEVANRVLGNAAADTKLTLDQLQREAVKYGFDPDINAIDQIIFNDILEGVIGSNQTRSLGGQVKRAFTQGQEEAMGIAEQAAKGNVPGVLKRVYDATLGRTKEERIRAIRALLGEPSAGTSSGLPAGVTDFGDTALPKAKAGPAANPATASAADIVTGLRERLKIAPEAKVYIDSEADKVIAGIPDAIVAKAPIKTEESSLRKIIKDYKGDIEKLKDLARNTIIPKTPEAEARVIKMMDARGDIERMKVQTPEDFFGYKGVVYNIKTPNGLIAETQVVSPKMTYGKNTREFSKSVIGEELFNKIKKETGVEPGIGHEIYEAFRDLNESIPADKARKLKLQQKSREYYARLQ